MFGDKGHLNIGYRSLGSRNIKEREVGLTWKCWEMVLEPKEGSKVKTDSLFVQRDHLVMHLGAKEPKFQVGGVMPPGSPTGRGER